MSAFAAILSADTSESIRGHNAVAAALTAISSRPVGYWQSGACRLLTSPLHDSDLADPIVDRGSGIAAVGEVCLEDRVRWARIAGAPADLNDLGVVAALAGQAPLPPLGGEYAFVTWDSRARTLSCARDPLGIRTLFVGAGGGTIVVSNLFSAVVSHPSVPRDLDSSALVRFLAIGSLTRTIATPLRAIRAVPEGHVLTIKDGGAVLRRHWEPPRLCATPFTDDSAVLDGYRDVLKDAVRDRIGGKRSTIFLSGGIDSTTLAVTAAECGADIRAATFEYRLCPVPGEAQLAREVAARLAIPIDVLEADVDEPLAAERRGETPPLPVDEPTLTNWRMVLAHAARYSTLAINGEDGDALMAPPPWAELTMVQSLPSTLWQSVRYLAQEARPPHLGLRLRQRFDGGAQITDPWPAWLTPEARRLLEGTEDDRVLGQLPQWLESAADTWTRLLTNVPRDFALTISPDVTRQRLTLTLPLMDSRVVAFVLSVPPVPWRQRKGLARRAFARQLPSSVLIRPKTPLRGYVQALAASWRATRVRETLAPKLSERGWLDGREWSNALATGDLYAAWRVVILEAWLCGGIMRT